MSINTHDISAMPVDHKLVVSAMPVSDKSVEMIKPHREERKDDAASSILPVYVDKGIQTNNIRDDPVPVHMEARVIDHRFVGAAVWRVGEGVHMQKGKDGRIR